MYALAMINFLEIFMDDDIEDLLLSSAEYSLVSSTVVNGTGKDSV